jgi:TRAP-type C4-dicarboxylate transport system permease large subunit
MILLVVFLLFLGCLLESTVVTLLLTPILVPVVKVIVEILLMICLPELVLFVPNMVFGVG